MMMPFTGHGHEENCWTFVYRKKPGRPRGSHTD
jgi:hypothetical protein